MLNDLGKMNDDASPGEMLSYYRARVILELARIVQVPLTLIVPNSELPLGEGLNPGEYYWNYVLHTDEHTVGTVMLFHQQQYCVWVPTEPTEKFISCPLYSVPTTLAVLDIFMRPLFVWHLPNLPPLIAHNLERLGQDIIPIADLVPVLNLHREWARKSTERVQETELRIWLVLLVLALIFEL